MDENTYVELINLVSPEIIRIDSLMRDAVTTHECLTARLRFLVTERYYEDLKFTKQPFQPKQGKKNFIYSNLKNNVLLIINAKMVRDF